MKAAPLLALLLCAPLAAQEFTLGLSYSDDRELGFEQGVEAIGGFEIPVSRRVAFAASGNLGQITKANADGGESWGYTAEVLLGAGDCQVRVGTTGGGYRADSRFKSIAGSLVGFRCKEYGGRLRWGLVAALKPTRARAISPDEFDQWTLSAPVSWDLSDRWRYGSSTSMTHVFGDELYGWSLWVVRVWR
jgi:hypothetical protein